MDKIVITGVGVVCGNASNMGEYEKSLFEGTSGIKQCSAFDTDGLIASRFGQVDGLKNEGRFFALIEKSANEMLCDAGITKEKIASFGFRCKLFFGTLLYNSESCLSHVQAKIRGEAGSYLSHMNDFSRYAREVTGVSGTAFVCSSACASGTTAAGMAFDYIQNGLCDCAVVAGVDALSYVTACGFNALQSLSPDQCRPYNEERNGITIGEGGAFFFFEKEDHAKKRGAHIYCEVSGYAIGNDAYHITSPDPTGDGAYRTMSAALSCAGWKPSDIDYIDGHGTGSLINDSMEIKAIEKLLGGSSKSIFLVSTKALIGHCMGASGALELASVLAVLKHGKTIPQPQLDNPMAANAEVTLSKESIPLSVNRALSCSFAFAGNSAAIAVQKAGLE